MNRFAMMFVGASLCLLASASHAGADQVLIEEEVLLELIDPSLPEPDKKWFCQTKYTATCKKDDGTANYATGEGDTKSHRSESTAINLANKSALDKANDACGGAARVQAVTLTPKCNLM